MIDQVEKMESQATFEVSTWQPRNLGRHHEAGCEKHCQNFIPCHSSFMRHQTSHSTHQDATPRAPHCFSSHRPFFPSCNLIRGRQCRRYAIRIIHRPNHTPVCLHPSWLTLPHHAGILPHSQADVLNRASPRLSSGPTVAQRCALVLPQEYCYDL